MTLFPESYKPAIAHSIFSDKDLMAYVGAEYNLSIVNCQLVKPLVSTTYVVSTPENNYILRIYPHDQPSSVISSEMAALLFLHQKGIRVSVPHPNTDGDYLTPITAPEGERLMTLTSYAEGIPLTRVENEAYFREFGRFVGSFHKLMDDQTGSFSIRSLDKTVLIEQPLTYIAKYYSRHIDELQFLNKTAETILRELDQYSSKELHYGFCHGDLNCSNVHVSPNGSLTLFDFEYCEIGWQAYDLGIAVSLRHQHRHGNFARRGRPDRASHQRRGCAVFAGHGAHSQRSRQSRSLEEAQPG